MSCLHKTFYHTLHNTFSFAHHISWLNVANWTSSWSLLLNFLKPAFNYQFLNRAASHLRKRCRGHGKYVFIIGSWISRTRSLKEHMTKDVLAMDTFNVKSEQILRFLCHPKMTLLWELNHYFCWNCFSG